MHCWRNALDWREIFDHYEQIGNKCKTLPGNAKACHYGRQVRGSYGKCSAHWKSVNQNQDRRPGLSLSMKTDDFHRQIENHLSAYFLNGFS